MLNFDKKKILIYGLGITGVSSYDYLKKKNEIYVFDDNSRNFPKKTIKKIIYKENIIKTNFDFIVISPGINLRNCTLSNYLKKNRHKIITDLDIFYFENPNNLKITITGTNGKSTTAQLLYEIFKNSKKDVRLAGNIGLPILKQKKKSKKTIFIIEASSYQIEYSQYFKTDVSTILNLTPDHLERHKTFSKYIKTKFKLIEMQSKNGIAIISKNNIIIKKLIKKKKVEAKIIKIGNHLYKNLVYKINNKYFENIANKENLIFAIAISKLFNIKNKLIVETVNKFKGLMYRQQILYNSKNFLIINDSKSTSFNSSVNLLKSFKNIFWILGGIPKKGDKFKLEKKYYKNINAYIYGKNKKTFIREFKNRINHKFYKNLKDILKTILLDKKLIKDKINIIFSPSSASFDQYKNFEERGKFFNQIINQTNFIKKLNAK